MPFMLTGNSTGAKNRKGPRRMSYDPACEELARYFLSDLARPELAAKLAQHIQDQIEEWIKYEADAKPVYYTDG